MPVVIPVVLTNGTLEDADQVMQIIDALAAKFDAGITAADAASGAGFRGDQLSTTLGDRIENANLETEAVDDRVLASDAASPGADAGRAVSGDHIKTLTAVQLARILPSTPLYGIGSDKLKFVIDEVSIGPGALNSAGTGFNAFPPVTARPTATYELIHLYLKGMTYQNALTNSSFFQVEAATSGANWTGGIRFQKDPFGVELQLTGKLVYVFMQKA